MDYAIAELQIALSVVENNAPINETAGNAEQSQYERDCAASYRAAIAALSVID